MNKSKSNPMLFMLVITILCIGSFFIVFLKTDFSRGYSLLPLMPIIYLLLILSFSKLVNCVPENMGATFIIGFEAIRMVISPALIVLSDYQITIGLNAEKNAPKAIILMIYECIVVFVVMGVASLKFRRNVNDTTSRVNPGKFKTTIIIILIIAIASIAISPQILNGYRTIFSVSDENYTTVEMSNIINENSVGFVSRFTMIISNNFLLILRILIPAMIIIQLSKKAKTLKYSTIVALSPFLIVDGTIGRSLYFSVTLFYLIYFLYDSAKVAKLLKYAIVSAVAFLCVYWSIRYKVANSSYTIYEYINKILSTYFCGVNMVSGSLNLSADSSEKAMLIIADIAKSIPFGNTLFKMQSVDYFQQYFCKVNNTYGMIPPVIGTGNFYFGFLLAPIYSAAFTYVSIVQGERAVVVTDPFKKTQHLIAALFFAMSFNMYSVQNTFALLFFVLIPIAIVNRIAIDNNDNEEYKRQDQERIK